MTNGPSLGTFLRSRRESIGPAEVGLPIAGRRRTPGLRREELALFAGMSVDYLIRLEQDRERRPSAAVLAALSDALRLNELERARLRGLAAIASQPELVHRAPPVEPLSDTAIALLERLDRTPAVIIDRTTDLAAWNDAYDWLMRPTGLLTREPPNLARFLFLDSTATDVCPDWPSVARAVVSYLQSMAASSVLDNVLEALVRDLRTTSDEFDRLWTRQEVVDAGRRREQIAHPDAGLLEFDLEALKLSGRPQRSLLVYIPADATSAAALETHAVAGAAERQLVG